MVASPETARRAPLDSPPPLPPRTATRQRTMMDAGQGPVVGGADAANPQIQALQAAQSIEQGFQQLVQMVPGMAQFGAAVISALRAQVADALAGSAAGPPGGAMPAPPPPMGGM